MSFRINLVSELHRLRDARRCALVLGAVGVCVAAASAIAWAAPNDDPKADQVEQKLAQTFEETIRPFVAAHCAECHVDGAAEGDLDLGAFETMDSVVAGYRRWEMVLERLEAEEMPPEEASSHPEPAERQATIDWIRTLRSHIAERDAGDPGEVLARRLSNAEYNYSIRDLTGVDIRPTAQFPVDPTNQAGFDNSGESLAMSPALLKKYLEAARLVSDHLVLLPEGLAFAPHPVVANTDRDKYCLLRIVDFYHRQPTDIAEYLAAAWRVQASGDTWRARCHAGEHCGRVEAKCELFADGLGGARARA